MLYYQSNLFAVTSMLIYLVCGLMDRNIKGSNSISNNCSETNQCNQNSIILICPISAQYQRANSTDSTTELKQNVIEHLKCT